MDPSLFDPTSLDASGLDENGLPLGGGTDASSFDPVYSDIGDTIVSDPGGGPVNAGPGVYADPGSNSGGSITPSAGSSAPGGSGLGTFLTSAASIFGSFARSAGIVGSPAQYGRTAAGATCNLGTAGCLPATATVASSQTTLLVLVGVGALVLIIALRK